jgi:PIN domain nuclease of toxin-antitoxin system
MRALIDTHALLWALSEPKRLPDKVRDILVGPEHSIYVSAATLWEICIKVALKKLSAKPHDILQEVSSLGFEELPVYSRHTLRLLELKAHHRDPFDRMLVAQALEEGLTLISHDPALSRYEAPILWD